MEARYQRFQLQTHQDTTLEGKLLVEIVMTSAQEAKPQPSVCDIIELSGSHCFHRSMWLYWLEVFLGFLAAPE